MPGTGPELVALGLVAVALGSYFLANATVRIATRPLAAVRPGPRTQELGPEPPAVVCFICDGLTEDAAEATLLDLAARDYLELRQPGSDPMHTTVHLTAKQSTDLTKYESRIYDRVSELAVDGVVPMTALTFRDSRRGKNWWKGFTADVRSDLRARGLSRPRLSRFAKWMLRLTATAAAAVLGYGVYKFAELHPDPFTHLCAAWASDGSRDLCSSTEDVNPLAVGPVVAALIVWVLLLWHAGRDLGERASPLGREAASRWLGVREWLVAHESFAELPPSAVAVWDRYLPYGAALGVTRVASQALDLGMADRKRLWSTRGGHWHRIRVRYPRRNRYGRPLPVIMLMALGLLVVARFVLVESDALVGLIQLIPPFKDGSADGIAHTGVIAVGTAMAALGLYWLLRSLGDLVAPRTLTGPVLWVERWRSKSRKGSVEVSYYYIAVDTDGRNETFAWALPAALRWTFDSEATVEMTVRPWTRRIIKIADVSAPASAPATEEVAEP